MREVLATDGSKVSVLTGQAASTATLLARAHFFWLTWAPAVLAAGGDWAREQATLARLGVALARAEYDDTLRHLRARELRDGLLARNEVSVNAARIDAALARTDSH